MALSRNELSLFGEHLMLWQKSPTPQQNLEIRLLTSFDFVQLAQEASLHLDGFTEENRHDIVVGNRWIKDRLILNAALCEGDVIHSRIEIEIVKSQNAATIYALCTRKQSLNKGYATILLINMLEQLIKSNINTIHLETSYDGISLYVKSGFYPEHLSDNPEFQLNYSHCVQNILSLQGKFDNSIELEFSFSNVYSQMGFATRLGQLKNRNISLQDDIKQLFQVEQLTPSYRDSMI